MQIQLFTPYDKQREIVNYCIKKTIGKKVVVVTKGRQVGLTLTGINITTYWALTEVNKVILVVLPTYKQLKKVLRQYATGLQYLIDIKEVSINKSDMEISFKNGTIIMLRSGESRDNIRSITAHYLWVDEAAYILDEVYYAAIKPTTATQAAGRCTLITSTPKGSKNWFYTMYHSGGNIKTYYLSSYDSPFIESSDIDEEKNRMPKILFEQEYLGRFVKDSGAVFTNIIKNSIINVWEEYNVNKQYFAGIDWGRKSDKSVLTIIDNTGRTVFVCSMVHTEYSKIIELFSTYLDAYKAVTIAEVNGVGDPLVESLSKLYSSVEPFVMTNTSKYDIVLKTVMSFNKNELFIPSEDFYGETYKECSEFEMNISTSGKITFSAPHGKHDDHVISLCLANWCKNKYYSDVIIYETGIY